MVKVQRKLNKNLYNSDLIEKYSAEINQKHKNKASSLTIYIYVLRTLPMRAGGFPYNEML